MSTDIGDLGGTPGPWEIGARGVQIISSEGSGRPHSYVADTNNRVNARLIAAAPELLWAVQNLLDYAGWENPDSSVADARAAIDKATGKDG